MPITLIAGMPLTNRKIHIKITAAMEIHAVRKKSDCIVFSFIWFTCLFLS